MRELLWQKRVEGNSTKIKQFQEVAGALQDFKTYLFLKKRCIFCTVMHSPMTFVALSDATQHLQGRFIGFVRDQMLTREPTAILLPSQKTWQWVKEAVSPDGPAIIKYYKDDPTRRGLLWTPETGTERVETTAPRLLYIPLVLFNLIREKGQPLMPHEVLTIVMAYIDSAKDNAVIDAWQLVAKWCLLASQMDGQGESWLAFAVNAVTEGMTIT